MCRIVSSRARASLGDGGAGCALYQASFSRPLSVPRDDAPGRKAAGVAPDPVDPAATLASRSKPTAALLPALLAACALAALLRAISGGAAGRLQLDLVRSLAAGKPSSDRGASCRAAATAAARPYPLARVRLLARVRT